MYPFLFFKKEKAPPKTMNGVNLGCFLKMQMWIWKMYVAPTLPTSLKTERHQVKEEASLTGSRVEPWRTIKARCFILV